MTSRILAPRVAVAFAVLCTLVWTSGVEAQLRRPRAQVTPLVEGAAAPGGRARVALKVVLPEGLHTQSNKPRDPNLIPTELTVDAPAGVTLSGIVWPKPTAFQVEGLPEK